MEVFFLFFVSLRDVRLDIDIVVCILIRYLGFRDECDL